MRIQVNAYINEPSFKNNDPFWSFQFNPEDVDETKMSLKHVESLIDDSECILLSKVKE